MARTPSFSSIDAVPEAREALRSYDSARGSDLRDLPPEDDIPVGFLPPEIGAIEREIMADPDIRAEFTDCPFLS